MILGGRAIKMPQSNDHILASLSHECAFLKSDCGRTLWPLMAHGQRRELRDGTFLWSQGDSGQHFALILSGVFEVSQWTSPGKDTLLGIFSTGDIIGLPAVLNHKAFPANAISLSETASVWLVPGDEFLRQINQSPQAEAALRDVVLSHESILRAKISALSAGTAEQRIAYLFCHLAERFGIGIGSSGQVRIQFRITRDQIGRMVNIRPETVIRILSRWHKEAIVLSNANEFVIPSMKTLEDILTQES